MSTLNWVPLNSPDFEVSRNGAVIARTDRFVSATRSRSFNKADRLTLQTDGSLDFQGGDLITWREAGLVTGIFVVDTPERLYQASGRMNVTATPLGTWRLQNTGWPGQGYATVGGLFSEQGFLEGLSLKAALDRIAGLTRALDSASRGVTFAQVNPAKTTTGIRIIEADTALRGLTACCNPSQSHWRCRAELEDPTIEVGVFGDVKDVQVVTPDFVPSAMLTGAGGGPEGAIYYCNNASGVDDYADGVNAVFAEGGTYEHVTYGTRTLTTLGATVPFGFRHTMIVMGEGRFYPLLEKVLDPDQRPYAQTRSRHISISGIAPNADPLDGKSRPSDVLAAAQALADAAVAYLRMYADGKKTWNVTVPAAMTWDFLPGDRIHAALLDEASGLRYAGELYVITHDTDWRGGTIASRLELSNVPDPYFDPLSVQYAGFHWQKVQAKKPEGAPPSPFDPTVVLPPPGEFVHIVGSVP